MAQYYDDIIRENMAELLFGLAKHMLGKDIQSNKPLNVSLRETLSREPDFLQIVEVEGKELILHIEFQSTDDALMRYREAIYNILIRMQEGEELALEQHILYLGEHPPERMQPPEDSSKLLIPKYTVHYFGNFPYTDFLFSPAPEVVVFTILCNFLGQDPEKVITQIIKRLSSLCSQELAFGKYLKQLEILAKKRNLQEQVIEIQRTMPFTYNLQEDIRFKQGQQSGIKLGKAQGIKLGEERGAEKEKHIRIKRMLSKGLSPELVVEWGGYEMKLVLEIQKKMAQE